MRRIRMPRTAPTTTPGYTNGNQQTVVRPTGAASASFAGQSVYELLCEACRHRYGTNGCEIHQRRCPACQGGEAGEPLREAVSLSLF